MSQRPRLLITGASGFLGSELCVQAAAAYEVYAISHSRTLPESLAPMRSRINLLDTDILAAAFNQFRPDLVIHCAAMSSPDLCEQSVAASQLINVEVPTLLASLCAESTTTDGAGPKLVFISSDQVFDGTIGNYDETTPVHPINVYGGHKFAAEHAVTVSGAVALVARLPLLFGSGRLAESWMERSIVAWSKGETVTGFRDEYRSLISYSSAARGLLQASEHPLFSRMGTLHLGGLQTVSRLEFLHMLAAGLQRFAEPSTLFSQAAAAASACTVGALGSEANLPASRPADLSLDSRKARQLELRMPFLEKQIDVALTCYDAKIRTSTGTPQESV